VGKNTTSPLKKSVQGFRSPTAGGRKSLSPIDWRYRPYNSVRTNVITALGGSSLRSTAGAYSVISRRRLIGPAATFGSQCRLTPRVTKLVHIVAVYRQQFDEIFSTHFTEHCKSSAAAAAAAAAGLCRTSSPLPTT